MEQPPRHTALRRSALAAGSVVAVTSLLLAGCGSKASETDSANATSCVDTSGPTIKVGALNSLSGTMAISEVTVRNAIDLAVEEINGAGGGVMGKQIQLVGEDGASEPTVFAEKAEKKLISSDCVAAVFGGWTSSSRKAMLPVFESANSLLYYPVQYEGGLEASPPTSSTPARPPTSRSCPRWTTSRSRASSRCTWWVATMSSHRPPTASSRRTRKQRDGDQGRGLHPPWARPISPRSSTRCAAPMPTRCSTPSTVTPTWRSSGSTRTSA